MTRKKQDTDMIREAIAAEVERAGWTQAELASRSGVAQPHISDILAGRRDPRASTLDRLLKALRLHVARDSD